MCSSKMGTPERGAFPFGCHLKLKQNSLIYPSTRGRVFHVGALGSATSQLDNGANRDSTVAGIGIRKLRRCLRPWKPPNDRSQKESKSGSQL